MKNTNEEKVPVIFLSKPIGDLPAVDMQLSSVNSVAPSFTGNSSNSLADIAARVVEEFRHENGHVDDDDDDIYNFTDDSNQVYVQSEDDSNGNCDEDGEFEFAVVCRIPNSSPADEIFSNGEILPRYPLFDRSLLLDDGSDRSDANSKPEEFAPVVRQPLGKLFREERESASCSSSEVDNLDGVAPEAYCIWKPKVESPERCNKSNSTGNSSKRWKFPNLLRRSYSESNLAPDKDASMVDFSPVTAAKKWAEKVKKVDNTAKVAGADDDGATMGNTMGNYHDQQVQAICSTICFNFCKKGIVIYLSIL